MNDSSKGNSLDIETRGLHAHVRRRTVRLLDFTDKRKGGTAVTIQIGDRHFLATAEHVIPEGHDIRILAGDEKELLIRGFVARHVSETDDVGLLELDESHVRLLNRDFTQAAQIVPTFDQDHSWAATILGYPTQLIDTDECAGHSTAYRTYRHKTLSLVTQTLPLSEWPTRGPFRRRQPDPSTDLFANFDPHEVLQEVNFLDVDSPLRNEKYETVLLNGISGGGIWLDFAEQSTVWHPAPLLIGLDTAVKAKERWVRATLMNRWLELVSSNYPELRQEVAEIRKRTVGFPAGQHQRQR